MLLKHSTAPQDSPWPIGTILQDGKLLGLPAGTKPWWQSFDTNRTLYIQPSCGLGNHLETIASALTISHREKVNIKVVFPAWSNPLHEVLWSEMFSAPVIDYQDSFPDGAYVIQNTTVNTFDLGTMIKENGMKMTWNDIKDEFEELGDGQQVLCMQLCLLQEDPFPRDERWFYKTLKPSAPVQVLIDDFKAQADWESYQWVGVHLRRGDRMDDLNAYLNETWNYYPQLLPLDNYVAKMKQVMDILPDHFHPTEEIVSDLLIRFESANFTRTSIRYFVASDDYDAAQYVASQFEEGQIVSFHDDRFFEDSDRTPDYQKFAQDSVAEMLLLSSCEVIIGTPTSSFSLAARLIGDGLYVEPELFDNAGE